MSPQVRVIFLVFTLLLSLTANLCSMAGTTQDQDSASLPFTERIQQLLALTPAAITHEVATFEMFDLTIRETAQVEDFDSARKLAEKAHNLYPGELRAGLLLGWLKGISGDLSGGIRITKEAIEGKTERLPDPKQVSLSEALTNLGGFLSQDGKFDEAIPFLERAIKTNPEQALPEFLLGEVYHHKNDPSQTLSAYTQAFAKNEKLATPDDYLFYAWAEDKAGNLEGAAGILQKAMKRFPLYPGLHLNLGINQEAREATAEAYYEYQLETLIEETGRYCTEAKKRIERIERKQVGLSPVLSQGELTGAKNEEIAAISEYLARRKQNDLGGAQKALDKGLAMNRSGHPYVSYLKAEALTDKGQYEDAIKVLEDTLVKYPEQLILEMDLAAAYGKAGRKEQADELIHKFMTACPDHWKVKKLVGPNQLNLAR